MTELILYREFALREDAEAVAAQLEKIGITTEVVKKGVRAAAIYIGNDYSDNYELRIATANFTAANKILLSNARVDIGEVYPRHPLYSMQNYELQEIIAMPEEWGPENYNVALALLKSRGVDISDQAITQMQEEHVAEMAARKPASVYLLALGYVLAFFPFLRNILIDHYGPGVVIWCFPGALGLLIGLVILKAKKTLPDGQRVPVYDRNAMKHGAAITILNLLSWVMNIVMFLYILF